MFGQIGRPLTPAERHELVVDMAVPRATVRAAVKSARAAQRMADATEAAQGIYAAQARDPITWTITRHDGPDHLGLRCNTAP